MDEPSILYTTDGKGTLRAVQVHHHPPNDCPDCTPQDTAALTVRRIPTYRPHPADCPDCTPQEGPYDNVTYYFKRAEVRKAVAYCIDPPYTRQLRCEGHDVTHINAYTFWAHLRDGTDRQLTKQQYDERPRR